jgi:putative membrane-bound dehydrogenase-like protein
MSSDGPSGRAAEPEAPGLAPSFRPRIRSARSGSRPASRSSWWPPSRWCRTRSRSTGAPTAGSGSSRWAITPSGSTARGAGGPGPHPGGPRRRRPLRQATVFLDGLGFPTGRDPLANGVIVACAPDICYAEDRDGDGKADHREILFTGFVEGNQQHRVNGFELGLDGWDLRRQRRQRRDDPLGKTGEGTAIGGRDFRFRPDTGAFEAESGQTQFGRHRDDWGHWFGNNNPNWGWHLRPLRIRPRRNPHFAPPDPRRTLEPSTRLYPISRTLDRFNDPGAANHVTSANSPTPYRDDLFGPGFARSLFVSEPVHNLVHRMVLEPDGVTFRGVRAPDETDREFLASATKPFRPTMLRTGPDGALWIADMYRAVIEHPEWIPDDWEARLDLRAGSERGRIYRVFPADRRPRPIPRLDRLDTAGLVAALESPNGWQARHGAAAPATSRRLRRVGPLRVLVAHTENPGPRCRPSGRSPSWADSTNRPPWRPWRTRTPRSGGTRPGLPALS